MIGRKTVWRFLAALYVGTLGLSSAAYATPNPTDVILDAGPLGNYCGNPITGCYGPAATSGANPNVGDVVGAKNDFDAKSIQFTTWTSTHVVGDVIFNYHSGDTSLTTFNDFGFLLPVGDLLFNAGGLDFGIALTAHDGLIAGDLYKVGGFLNSDQFGLNHSQVIWRDTYWCQHFGGSNCSTPDVRMNSLATGLSLLGTGTVSVAVHNEGLYDAGIELDAHLDFNPGGDSGVFWQTYLANGLDASFAAAICANDIVEGHITPAAVPEPAPWLLLGAGWAGLVLWRRKVPVAAKI